MPLIEFDYMGTPEPNRNGGSNSELGISNFTLGLIGVVVFVAVFVLPRMLTPRMATFSSSEHDRQLYDPPIASVPKYNRYERLTQISPIDINTAPYGDLILLPRVNETLATAIITGRPYSDVDQLDDVYGIGPKTLELLRPHVIVNEKNIPRNSAIDSGSTDSITVNQNEN
jgi:hypothetical protein